MNLKKCSRGHYYDAEKYESCPHCQKTDNRDDSKTFAAQSTFDMQSTFAAQSNSGKAQTVSLMDAVRAASSPLKYEEEDDKTVSYYGGSMQTEPVVGWLVCVAGECLGKAFELKNGKNFVGRASNMDIILEGDSNVSRERHAIVTYEPTGRLFVAQPGESRELFYVNDQVVLMNKELKDRDILLIGKTKLMFIPLCGPDFAWEDVKTR